MALTRSEAKIEALEKTVQDMQENITSLTKTVASMVDSQAKMLELKPRWSSGFLARQLMIVRRWGDPEGGRRVILTNQIVGKSDKNADESEEECEEGHHGLIPSMKIKDSVGEKLSILN